MPTTPNMYFTPSWASAWATTRNPSTSSFMAESRSIFMRSTYSLQLKTDWKVKTICSCSYLNQMSPFDCQVNSTAVARWCDDYEPDLNFLWLKMSYKFIWDLVYLSRLGPWTMSCAVPLISWMRYAVVERLNMVGGPGSWTGRAAWGVPTPRESGVTASVNVGSGKSVGNLQG